MMILLVWPPLLLAAYLWCKYRVHQRVYQRLRPGPVGQIVDLLTFPIPKRLLNPEVRGLFGFVPGIRLGGSRYLHARQELILYGFLFCLTWALMPWVGKHIALLGLFALSGMTEAWAAKLVCVEEDQLQVFQRRDGGLVFSICLRDLRRIEVKPGSRNLLSLYVFRETATGKGKPELALRWDSGRGIEEVLELRDVFSPLGIPVVYRDDPNAFLAPKAFRLACSEPPVAPRVERSASDGQRKEAR